MVARIPVFATVLSALATAVVAVPEVIPGPGLPSLASLNLTSAELYARGPPPALSARAADYAAFCEIFNTAAVDDVITCFNFLVEIGNNPCVVGEFGPTSGFCRYKSASIIGSMDPFQPLVESSCGDVAKAVRWVFTYCGTVNGEVGGFQAADGNGNLIVSVVNI